MFKKENWHNGYLIPIFCFLAIIGLVYKFKIKKDPINFLDEAGYPDGTLYKITADGKIILSEDGTGYTFDNLVEAYSQAEMNYGGGDNDDGGSIQNDAPSGSGGGGGGGSTPNYNPMYHSMFLPPPKAKVLPKAGFMAAQLKQGVITRPKPMTLKAVKRK